ncbi:MAG: right-handed parallel beta-helix repeat-containing protein [Phycisphaerales bacterium]
MILNRPQIALAFAVAGVCAASLPAQQTIKIDRDNIEIREDTVIASGVYEVEDTDGNGVLHVVADGVTIDFGDAVLDGAPASRSPDEYTGYGVRLDAVSGVTIRGGTIRGFKGGVYATNADRLTVEDLTLRDNFRQRLRSTPQAEANSDWLWPHRNDENEWLNNYGAGLYIEDSDEVTVRRVVARETQNGVIIDRVNDSRLYDNDCSFLSGWGLAMWRSNRNVITRNAFDFCIRGYSHGVYNRGQDSAGILMFEQNSDNVIAENSATHGGDGFFGFAGRDALGETWLEEQRSRLRDETGQEQVDQLIEFTDAVIEAHRRKGNNDNLLINNDFSYAAAHGIEMTFSFGNRFIGNRLVENAICGVWGGYSKDTLIADNTMERNGEGAYGMERGGINIEHGARNRVESNTFRENKCGVYFWWDPDPGLLITPWAKANGAGSDANSVTKNSFEGDEIAIQLVKTDETVIAQNAFEQVGVEIDADEESEPVTEVMLPAVIFQPPDYPVFGVTRPVGARDHLRGRHQIIMTEWGPWDHESPLLRALHHDPGDSDHVWELQGAGPIDGIRPIEPDLEALRGRVEWGSLDPTGATGRIAIGAPTEAGVSPYRIRIKAGEFESEVAGVFVVTEWQIRAFPWTVDPRDDYDGWLAESRGDEAVTGTSRSLKYNFAFAGPSEASISRDITDAQLAPDRFGTIATTSLPIPAGTWKITTISDDGIRVLVDGSPVIENWTWHAPTRNTGQFTLDEPREVVIRVEHFEIDGYAQLDFSIDPVN